MLQRGVKQKREILSRSHRPCFGFRIFHELPGSVGRLFAGKGYFPSQEDHTLSKLRQPLPLLQNRGPDRQEALPVVADQSARHVVLQEALQTQHLQSIFISQANLYVTLDGCTNESWLGVPNISTGTMSQSGSKGSERSCNKEPYVTLLNPGILIYILLLVSISECPGNCLGRNIESLEATEQG